MKHIRGEIESRGGDRGHGIENQRERERETLRWGDRDMKGGGQRPRERWRQAQSKGDRHRERRQHLGVREACSMLRAMG